MLSHEPGHRPQTKTAIPPMFPQPVLHLPRAFASLRVEKDQVLEDHTAHVAALAAEFGERLVLAAVEAQAQSASKILPLDRAPCLLLFASGFFLTLGDSAP